MSEQTNNECTPRFLPAVSQEVLDRPIFAEEGGEMLLLLNREQPHLVEHLDKVISQAMGNMPLGACPHCVAMNAISICYAFLKSQVETDALKELVTL
jgi:hypothetical protein